MEGGESAVRLPSRNWKTATYSWDNPGAGNFILEEGTGRQRRRPH